MIKSTWVTSLLAITFLGTLEMAHAETFEIPIRQDADGRPRVEITVNDSGVYDFIVDTGMMQTMILPDLEDAFPDQGPLNLKIGEEVSYQLVNPSVLRNMKISEEPVFGILGSEFLQKYVVGMDMEQGVMILAESGPLELFPDSEFEKLSMYSPFANLWMSDEIQLGSLAVTAFLDTGANRTFINSRTVEKLPPGFLDYSSSTKGEARTGSSSKMEETQTVVTRVVSAGERKWENRELTVSDGILSQLRLAEKPAMLMGADLMLTGRLILDYAGGFVYFEIAPGPE